MTMDERRRNLMAIDRLRQAACRRAPPPGPPTAVAEYDWARPHHFTAAGHRRLAAFARRVADGLGRALAQVTRTDASLVADPPAECYPRDVDPGGTTAYYVPLRDAAGRPCGALRFPTPLAAAWVERLLGGSPSARTQVEDLSPLEAGLLLDVAGWMVKTISEVAASAGTTPIQHEAALAAWDEAMPTDAGEELCRFGFRKPPESPGPEAADAEEDAEPDGTEDLAAETEADDSAAADQPADPEPAAAEEAPTSSEADPDAAPTGPALLLASRFLEPLADDDPAAHAASADPDAVHARIRARIEEAPVEVHANLGTASIGLGDLLALEPGDIVVLDRAVGETIDLSVDGQIVLRARPAVSAGQYAVQVQDLRRPTVSAAGLGHLRRHERSNRRGPSSAPPKTAPKGVIR